MDRDTERVERVKGKTLTKDPYQTLLEREMERG
jgi:hypothetical protein